MIAADGDADAHRRIDFLAKEVERNRQRLLNARGHGTGLFFTGYIVEQHRKLVSTNTAEHIVLSQASLDAMRDLDQQLISTRVAETVVDQLEPIDVEQQHSILAILVRRFTCDA